MQAQPVLLRPIDGALSGPALLECRIAIIYSEAGSTLDPPGHSPDKTCARGMSSGEVRWTFPSRPFGRWNYTAVAAA
jgi:hypothetical protein